MPGLPPLTALRAFEAAARHLSFAKAAQELGVTPAAVSQQIRGLEDFLGIKLFRRMTRAVMLTDAAQAALPALRDGFDRLAEGVALIEGHGERGMLVISTTPTITARWLVPRLQRFHGAYPEIDVRLDTTNALADFSRDDVDIAIRFGRGEYAGLEAHVLFKETVTPVCSPRLLEGPTPLRGPEDLRHHLLLHDEWPGMWSRGWPDWGTWLLAAGVTGVDTARGMRVSVSDVAIQVALEGQGVALTGLRVVDDLLAAGRLVAPFALSLPLDLGYFVVYPSGLRDQPKIAAFRDWVLAEARASERERGDQAAKRRSPV